jgi:PIN domain nuclease of toxin-antitoxin system
VYLLDTHTLVWGLTVPERLPAHVTRLDALAAIGRDPFDRMLVAQALAEECTLVTRLDAVPVWCAGGLGVRPCART